MRRPVLPVPFSVNDPFFLQVIEPAIFRETRGADIDTIHWLRMCFLCRPDLYRTAERMRLGMPRVAGDEAIQSRVMRAGLPSLRVVRERARLIRVAALLQDPRVTAADAAAVMRYSAPQHLSRTVQIMTGDTVTVWRRQETPATLFAAWMEQYIVPHATAWEETIIFGHRPWVPRRKPSTQAAA